MSRTLSTTAIQSAFSADTNEVWAALLTIDHANLVTPIRITANGANIDSNGETFISCPFRLELPSEEEGTISKATLTIENISRLLVPIIRTIDRPPSIQVDIVLASSPNTLEVSYTDFILTDVSYNSLTVTGTFSQENFLAEPYPGSLFAPSLYPSLV